MVNIKTGRTVLRHDVKNWLLGKDPDAGKDWWQEEKGTTEDEIVGWHHQLDGHELSKLWSWWWQLSLVCCSPWVRKELDTTEWLNWTKDRKTENRKSLSEWSKDHYQKEKQLSLSTCWLKPLYDYPCYKGFWEIQLFLKGPLPPQEKLWFCNRERIYWILFKPLIVSPANWRTEIQNSIICLRLLHNY